MWAALIAVLRWFDQERREVKLGLSVVLIDLIIFIIIEASIVTTTKSLLNPIVMWVGIGWIVATAVAIWFLGGIEVDALVLAKIVGLKIGDEFVNAILVFGMIHVWIVSFFMLIPVWQFWPGFAGIIIALMGWALSAPLAGAKFNWDYVRRAYIAMVVAITALIVLVGAYKFATGKEISLEAIRSTLQGGLGMLLMGAVLLLILGSIPKMPARKLMQWVGAVAIVAIVCLAFFWPAAKRELVAMGRQTKTESEAQQAAGQQKAQEITVEVKSGEKKVHTGLFPKKGGYIQYVSNGIPFWTIGRPPQWPDYKITTRTATFRVETEGTEEVLKSAFEKGDPYGQTAIVTIKLST